MRDWKTIAKAQQIGIPEGDIERTVEPLREMDQIFQSLLSDLTPDIEPAFELRLEGEE